MLNSFSDMLNCGLVFLQIKFFLFYINTLIENSLFFMISETCLFNMIVNILEWEVMKLSKQTKPWIENILFITI